MKGSKDLLGDWVVAADRVLVFWLLEERTRKPLIMDLAPTGR